MIVLGIETSCDETAAALVENGRTVLSTVVASSMSEFAHLGGVVPELAARKQVESIIPVLEEVLKKGNKELHNRPDAIAVTKGPGLRTSLFVGTTAARMLASVWNTPIIGVHHTLGHLTSPWLECEDEIHFPVLALSVSGGHTELWLRKSHTRGLLLGATRDDAAGEAFDKGATLLGLPYPGGPALSQMAQGGNPHFVEFPRPLLGEQTYDFSYSGLKTALKYALRDRGGLDALSAVEQNDIAASYQEAICLHLSSRIKRALQEHSSVSEVHLVGGVAANARLREQVIALCTDHILRIPPIKYCTDNAAMIAAAGYMLDQELGTKAYTPFTTQTASEAMPHQSER